MKYMAMTRKDVIEYIKKVFNVDPDHPFRNEYAETEVFRHRDTAKWFALCMQVRADRLGHEREEWVDVVTMKSEPVLIDNLISKKGFYRAYHMNKKQWLTVELNEDTPAEEVKNLLEMSFELTDKKKK